jgi:hypothetical protein
MINDDGRDDGLTVPMPRLRVSAYELSAREELSKRLHQPITPEWLKELQSLGRQEPEIHPPAVPLTAEEVTAELKRVDAELRSHGLTDARTSRPHRNRI